LLNGSLSSKEEIYVLSLCKASTLNDEMKKHLLWKLHGRDGYGVILRLNLKNPSSSWYSYYLASCFYNLKNFESLIQLNKFTKKEILDVLPAAFIKLPIYEFENEIRLTYDNRNPFMLLRQNKLIYPKTYLDKLNQAQNISYFELPLYNFFKDEVDIYPIIENSMKQRFEIPKIEITEVILGYRYSSDDLKNVQEKIFSLGINLHIRLSNLKKYF
jgi:hypothetical protein